EGGHRHAHRHAGARRADMTPDAEVLESSKQDMEKTLAAFRKELSHVRTGRAHTALLEGITVDYYGAKTPLNQVATLSAPEATLLIVQPYDKSVLGAIEKANKSSDLGLNPLKDGKLIRAPSPALTEPRGGHHGRQRALGGAARPLAPAGAPRRQGIGAGGGRGQPAPRHPLPLALRLLHRELAPPAARGRRAHGAPPPLPGDRARQDDEASEP